MDDYGYCYDYCLDFTDGYWVAATASAPAASASASDPAAVDDDVGWKESDPTFAGGYYRQTDDDNRPDDDYDKFPIRGTNYYYLGVKSSAVIGIILRKKKQ